MKSYENALFTIRSYKILSRLQKLKERIEDVQGMLDAYGTPVDFRAKENISHLIEYVLN